MPLYIYKCEVCGEQTEARQKFSDDPLKACPHCGAPEGLYRVIQNAGIVFKGSGFYINDSKGSKESLTGSVGKTSTETGSSNGAKTDSPASTESKPAPTSDSKKTTD